MSDILSPTIAHPNTIESVRAPRSAWRRWPKLIILLLIFLWLANVAISFAIQHTALRRKITARLESAFGRSVEVGNYSFSLWGRPTLEASSVVVGEDPRFGGEYFLRAESLTMSVRWQSLLTGHLEFGTISLSRPSLNLVRNPDGDWNLAEWLPRFSLAPGVAAAPHSHPTGASTALRFSRINVDSGRINFKRGTEKLPFAFVGVTGYVEPAGPGQWRMDLEATPTRAAVILQQAGTLHLSGHLGGTSSRLRPAALDLAWTDASIPDVLRLARATDYGIRGNLALVLNARTGAQDWVVESRAEIRELHRWDLPLRPDNPSLNIIVKGTLDPELARFAVAESTLETPRSNARATGALTWLDPASVARLADNSQSQSNLQIVSSGIDLADVLAWTRAFHSGVSADVALRGFAKLDLALGGWPPRVATGNLSIEGADLTSTTLLVPVRLGLASLHYDSNGFSLLPSTISFGAAGGALHIETGPSVATKSAAPASTKAAIKEISAAKLASPLHISGAIADAGNLISAARLLGWDISRGWDLTGPVRCDLKWQGSPYPWQTSPTGTLDFGAPPGSGIGPELAAKSSGDSLRAPFLNLPVEQIRAHVDLKPNTRHVAVSSAEAFGARWTGTFDRRDLETESAPAPANPWQFSLSADHLSAADLDRWLNPRWRQSFLDRVLPFLNSQPLAAARPELLAANGNITIDQFTLAPFQVHRLQADAAVDGRRLALSNARAQFYKGDISGTLHADLDPIPSYRLNLDFSGVDLAALSAPVPSLDERFAGVASGKISLSTHGASRADLVSALQCRGTARINAPELKSINLTDSLSALAFRPGASAFREATAAFTCTDKKLEFQHLLLSTAAAELSAEGIFDFSRNLDFKLTVLPAASSALTSRAATPHSDSYRLSGPLSSPEITLLKSASARP